MRKKRTRKVAALLSVLFPGLGQLYNRQLGKGMLFAAIAISLLLGYRPSRLSTAAILVMIALPYFGLWVYSILDAWYGAKGAAKHDSTRDRLQPTP
jgi:TM2 domain-containing membrane protein YozV